LPQGSDIGPADTARMIVTAVLVLMMTVPGLALFRGTAGLLEGNLHLLLTQLYGVAVTMAWSAGVTYVLLEPVSDFVPLRISLQQEPEGLDISQHGEALR
jgi:ammonium transporter, Amt family